jgi:hypothetical protein
MLKPAETAKGRARVFGPRPVESYTMAVATTTVLISPNSALPWK